MPIPEWEDCWDCHTITETTLGRSKRCPRHDFKTVAQWNYEKQRYMYENRMTDREAIAIGIDYGFKSQVVSYRYNPADNTAYMVYTEKEEQPEMDRLSVVDAEIRLLQKERAVLARFPKDNFDEGTVIKFERVFGGPWDDAYVAPVYTYAAVKVGALWYLTAGDNRPQQRMTWATLTEWLGDSVGEMWLMTPDVDLLAPANVPALAESPVVVTLEEPTKGGTVHADEFLPEVKLDDEATGKPIREPKRGKFLGERLENDRTHPME